MALRHAASDAGSIARPTTTPPPRTGLVCPLPLIPFPCCLKLLRLCFTPNLGFPDKLLAGTARNQQGRARLWRGEANPCLASTVLALRAISDGRRSGNTFPLVSFERFGFGQQSR